MTTPRQPVSATPDGHGGSLRDAGTAPTRAVPAAALRGRLGIDAEYAFSDRQTGTMSAAVGDGDPAANRASLAAALDLRADQVAWMHQVHGGAVTHASTPLDPPPSCDGIVTTTPGLGVAVLAADCVPVLMAAPGGVAAAHAGRAGLLADVAATTAADLAEATGCATDAVHALIGPAIGPCCYEVPADMADAVERAVPGTAARTTWDTPSLDLVAGVRSQLEQSGLTDVDELGGCTRCGGDARWFSHRATGGADRRPAGRQAGIIVHRPSARQGATGDTGRSSA